MKPEIATLWTAALRSGEYRQTTQELKNGAGFCCLGVLCDLHRKAVPGHDWSRDLYLGEETDLPEPVAEWAGMEIRDGSPGHLPEAVYINGEINGTHLAILNDDGATFKQIADVIEKYKDAL